VVRFTTDFAEYPQYRFTNAIREVAGSVQIPQDTPKINIQKQIVKWALHLTMPFLQNILQIITLLDQIVKWALFLRKKNIIYFSFLKTKPT